MLRTLRRLWRYLHLRFGPEGEQVDPRAQLERAIFDAREQHRLLSDHAANVIANQAQLNQRLELAIESLGRATTSARQALVLADEADKAGDAARAGRFNQTARDHASRILGLEREIDSLKPMVLEATKAADTARAIVRRNSEILQRTLAERERLLSHLDQAELHEQMSAAMGQLRQSVGAGGPSYYQLRRDINRRLATARALVELRQDAGYDGMLEVEQETRQAEALGRLEDLRSELGLGAASSGDEEPPDKPGRGSLPGAVRRSRSRSTR